MPAKSMLRIQFGLAVLVLGASATLLQVAKSKNLLRIIKAPLPVRKPLDQLDRRNLLPFEVINAETFSEEIVEELGTNQYISWVVKTLDPKSGDYRGGTVSVTYYTGVVDQVPHVPEECMTQGIGAFTLDSDDSAQMQLSRLGQTIPIRKQVYLAPRRLNSRTYVYYTFSVNGEFLANRTAVRRRMASISDTHLYYSKVEVGFKAHVEMDTADIDERARDLLDRVITELVAAHWPLKGWERGGPPVDTDKGGARGQVGRTSS